MDRDQRSRQQKSRGGSFTRPAAKRSLSSRMGLQKGPAPRPSSRPQNRRARPQQPAPPPARPARPQERPQPQLNPQKAGYIPGSPGMRRQRRVTQAEILRRRNRRRALGLLAVLAVLVLGGIVSVNLLFKVTAFRVENFDRSTPADTGIYTEDEIVAALGIEKNSNLFGFSAEEKTRQLQTQFPYLDAVQVDIQLPGTVVLKVRPATERFACMYSGGWLVLSDSLKILRVELSQPSDLSVLTCSLPADFTPAVGQVLVPGSYNSLLEGDAATPESSMQDAAQILSELTAQLESEGLSDGVTAIDILDLSQMSFTYQGRIRVLLGNDNRLDYKVRLAATAILDPDKGLSSSDAGTLDVSYQQSDGEIRGYFAPDEPEPTPTPEAGGENGGDAESGSASEET
ncbi:FtsQ-type POTRA domain-containing protein [uncultured Subdoligranulum sp.]|uniref:cell division protein FtsQ/DivIB n=1 Tax=uncultured Subdoligranulum sp. TaxID=512298 RepID=UPI0025F7ABF3|nr:FtsQ-type POTRA domain-containing protein [uncultured Subdoligranulum sp.]